MSAPEISPAQVRRALADCRSLEEVDGYAAEAKRRGITTDEVTMILERKRELLRGRA